MSESKLFGVFAYPVGHSLSPLMHNAAFQKLGLPHYYHGFEIHPDTLKKAVQSLPALGIGGVNVTIPLKEKVIPFLDDVDEEAQVIGAVNTIVVQENGRLKGYNTDGAGYVQSLMAETNIDLSTANILLLGAGGAAKGIAVYLLKHGCPQLTIANRTLSKAENLAVQLREYVLKDQLSSMIQCMDWLTISDEPLQAYNVIINTMPIGMWPNIDETPVPGNMIKANTIVSDIVYNPLKTRLLTEAQRQGAVIHQGLGMFVYQGALAFTYFTGHHAPVDHMRQVVWQRLQQRR